MLRWCGRTNYSSTWIRCNSLCLCCGTYNVVEEGDGEGLARPAGRVGHPLERPHRVVAEHRTLACATSECTRNVRETLDMNRVQSLSSDVSDFCGM